MCTCTCTFNYIVDLDLPVDLPTKKGDWLGRRSESWEWEIGTDH